MELSWSTFLLEIINFLVLVWILKHFLYRPVLEVIARRRAGIEDRLAEVRRLHDETDALKAEYENRLTDWDHERQQARDALVQELDEERVRQMEALQTTLAQEREKVQVAESRRHAEAVRETEHHALRQSAQFAARLLTQAAGPELETRLFDLLVDDLSVLSGDQIAALRTQWGEPPEAIMVTSAYPLPEEQRQRLEETLTKVTGLAMPAQYEQNPDLLAGLRITIGAWTLQANARDELKGFTEFAHAAR
ncbi:MAG: F0F1 ATP synthase subunit delta [Gammaproteobacteria bacterium]|nr:MAG: F0F1 ATP synthase subunit delta [Gammaproteobacteria bacterium]